jgi:hypothetical protein
MLVDSTNLHLKLSTISSIFDGDLEKLGAFVKLEESNVFRALERISHPRWRSSRSHKREQKQQSMMR